VAYYKAFLALDNAVSSSLMALVTDSMVLLKSDTAFLKAVISESHSSCLVLLVLSAESSCD